MFSDQYIIKDVEPLIPNQTVEEALLVLNKLHIDMLPLVDNQKLVNYISYENLEGHASNVLLSRIPFFTTVLPFVTPNQHIINVLSQLKTLNLSLLAVLDDENNYVGILKTKDIVKALSQSLSVKSQGSIIVIRLKPQDFSLSDIVRIIEYGDAKVLGFFTFEIENSDELELHLKLSTTFLRNILATLERYEYNVVQYYNREDANDDNDWRYEHLMKFIDL
ncbi:MAG: CBS domain-containing protein [Bacteroidota bacterium]|nr:CBS domain-containing protein [Bacteroidota bacterium]